MKDFLNDCRASVLQALAALAVFGILAGNVATAAPRLDESELLAVGFKVLVATTPVQEKWVKGLAPGKIRPMQRNGKKLFVYPDATKAQVYVGGPAEYAAYLKLHPESQQSSKEATDKTNAYRVKQDDVMRKANATDLSDPFLGASWADFGW